MTYYVDGIDCDLMYYTADLTTEIAYFRSKWKARNTAYRRLRARGVSVTSAIQLSREGV